MSFYGDMQAIATGLLTEFDQGGLSLDKYTPGSGRPTYTSQPFPGAARGVTSEHLKDSMVEATDLVVTVPAAMTPAAEDRVTVNGRSHQIIKIIRMPAAGIVAAWQVIVRS